MGKIDLCCPYCEKKDWVHSPKPPKGSINRYLEPTELPVMCLPYTRDIGKFDPKPEEDIHSAESWSRIGKDYLPFISFEKFGILRIGRIDTQEEIKAGEKTIIDVQYRVQKCAQCGNLFDVFANGLHETVEIVQRLFDNRASLGNK